MTNGGGEVKYEIQFKLGVKSRPSQLFFNFFILKSTQLSRSEVDSVIKHIYCN